LEGEIRRMRLKVTQKDVVFEKEIEGRKRKLEEIKRIREKLEEKKTAIEKTLQNTLSRTEIVLQEKQAHEVALTHASQRTKALKSELSHLQEEGCRLAHCPLKDTSTDRETETSDSFLMDKENCEVKGELERQLEYLQRENKLLKQTRPIQLGRVLRDISTTQAMAVQAQPERSCCT